MVRRRGIPRTPEEIQEQYKVGISVGTIKYQKKIDLMKKQAQKVSSATAVLQEVKKVLDRHGIYGNLRTPYLNLARELWHCMNRYSDQALIECADVKRAKYMAMGLDASTIDDILAVMGITSGGRRTAPPI